MQDWSWQLTPPNRYESGWFIVNGPDMYGNKPKDHVYRWNGESLYWETPDGDVALVNTVWKLVRKLELDEPMPNNAYDAYVQASKEDIINSPSHYTARVPEPINVIRDWGLNFCLGNAVKYIARAGLKGGPEKAVEDLEKARKYLEFEVERLRNFNGVR